MRRAVACSLLALALAPGSVAAQPECRLTDQVQVRELRLGVVCTPEHVTVRGLLWSRTIPITSVTGVPGETDSWFGPPMLAWPCLILTEPCPSSAPDGWTRWFP